VTHRSAGDLRERTSCSHDSSSIEAGAKKKNQSLSYNIVRITVFPSSFKERRLRVSESVTRVSAQLEPDDMFPSIPQGVDYLGCLRIPRRTVGRWKAGRYLIMSMVAVCMQ
jgi:hypothetical protein